MNTISDIITKKQSYSSLSLFKQCPRQYKLKYIDKNYISVENISLDLGNLCHKIKEIQMDKTKESPMEYLLDILENGLVDEENPRDTVVGLKHIKNKYFEDFYTVSAKSNLTYDDKMKIFIKSLQSNLDNQWETLETEKEFNINVEDVEIGGKIDRIDINKTTGDIRVVDYKTNDKIFDTKELPTALQMYIYNLAIRELYGKFPIENIYDFILLGKTQYALTKGWEGRGEKALNKLIGDLSEAYTSVEFAPKPCPLCAFCPFSGQSYTKNVATNGMCQYYSLWTRENKTFAVNKEYDPIEDKNSTGEKRETFEW